MTSLWIDYSDEHFRQVEHKNFPSSPEKNKVKKVAFASPVYKGYPPGPRLAWVPLIGGTPYRTGGGGVYIYTPKLQEPPCYKLTQASSGRQVRV